MDQKLSKSDAIKFRSRRKRRGMWRVLRRLIRLRRRRIPAETLPALEFLLACGLAGFNRMLPAFFGVALVPGVAIPILVIAAILFADVLRRLWKAPNTPRFALPLTIGLMVLVLYVGFYGPIRAAAANLRALKNPSAPDVHLLLSLPAPQGFQRGPNITLTNALLRIQKEARVDERQIRCAVKIPMVFWQPGAGPFRLGLENSSLFAMTNVDVQLALNSRAEYAISPDWQRAITDNSRIHEFWLTNTPPLPPQSITYLPPLYFKKIEQGPFMVMASFRAPNIPPQTIAFFYLFSSDVTEPKIVPLQFVNGRFKEVGR